MIFLAGVPFERRIAQLRRISKQKANIFETAPHGEYLFDFFFDELCNELHRPIETFELLFVDRLKRFYAM